MRRIVLLVILLAIYATTIQKTVKAEQHESKHTNAVSKPKIQADVRIERLQVFFQRFHSPFVSLSSVFIAEADKNGIDWRLLPVVACVESSCGKYYQRNAFGWGSDSLDYGDDAADIREITHRIAILPYYQTYKKSRRSYDFALAYNHDNAKEYAAKLEYFYEKL